MTVALGDSKHLVKVRESVWSRLNTQRFNGGEGSPHLPLKCGEHNWVADFFCLCWTFRLSTVKEINLFLPARVSLIFPSPALCLPFLFMTLSPLFQWVCWLSLSPPASSSLLPSLPFIWRAGSGVTNYSERAEKVVWALPSGLPCCIIIRETAGRLQPLAASTGPYTLS